MIYQTHTQLVYIPSTINLNVIHTGKVSSVTSTLQVIIPTFTTRTETKFKFKTAFLYITSTIPFYTTSSRIETIVIPSLTTSVRTVFESIPVTTTVPFYATSTETIVIPSLTTSIRTVLTTTFESTSVIAFYATTTETVIIPTSTTSVQTIQKTTFQSISTTSTISFYATATETIVIPTSTTSILTIQTTVESIYVKSTIPIHDTTSIHQTSFESFNSDNNKNSISLPPTTSAMLLLSSSTGSLNTTLVYETPSSLITYPIVLQNTTQHMNATSTTDRDNQDIDHTTTTFTYIDTYDTILASSSTSTTSSQLPPLTETPGDNSKSTTGILFSQNSIIAGES